MNIFARLFSELATMTKNESGIVESANELKKSIGKAVIQTNSDILALLQVYKKSKAAGTVSLSEKDIALQDRVRKACEGLDDTAKALQSQSEYVTSEGLEKLLNRVGGL